MLEGFWNILLGVSLAIFAVVSVVAQIQMPAYVLLLLPFVAVGMTINGAILMCNPKD
tara:strand:+ start:140 stop:310 length:171 start_codon:yes stop_codon:yes gene_type:complete